MKTSSRATQADPHASGEKTRPESVSSKAPARAEKPEQVARAEKPARAERHQQREDDVHLSASRRLYGARSENAHVRGGGDAEALWPERPRGKGRAQRTQDPEKLQQDLDRTKDQIDRAADRLERMWQRGDRRFRERVLAELEKNGQLTPELRAEIADELTRAHRLERQIQWTRNPERRAALEAEYKQVTEKIEQTLADNGVELEFLKAVERAAGEASGSSSLTGLLEKFTHLTRELFALKAAFVLTGNDLFKPQKDRVQRAKAVEDDDLSARLARELEQLVAADPQAV